MVLLAGCRSGASYMNIYSIVSLIMITEQYSRVWVAGYGVLGV